MHFLVDESCDSLVIDVLRSGGHDVLAVAAWNPGATDTEVIELALRDGRVLVTEDKDFGQLVYAAGHGHNGVVLLRYPFVARRHIATALSELAASRGAALSRAFAVIEPGRIRIVIE